MRRSRSFSSRPFFRALMFLTSASMKLALFAEVLFCCHRAIGAPPKKTNPPIFEKDIVPLLTRYCYGCHGEKKKGDLGLRIYLS